MNKLNKLDVIKVFLKFCILIIPISFCFLLLQCFCSSLENVWIFEYLGIIKRKIHNTNYAFLLIKVACTRLAQLTSRVGQQTWHYYFFVE